MSDLELTDRPETDELFSEQWTSQLVDALTEAVIAHLDEQAPSTSA